MVVDDRDCKGDGGDVIEVGNMAVGDFGRIWGWKTAWGKLDSKMIVLKPSHLYSNSVNDNIYILCHIPAHSLYLSFA